MKFIPMRLLAAAVVLVFTLAVSSAAAPHGILWARGQQPADFDAAASSNLLYYGGPVIEHAKVYAVFWGDTVDPQTQAQIGPFFNNILDSTYMDWLSQYNTDRTAVNGRPGTKQKISRGAFAGALTIQPSNSAKHLTDAMIRQELESQIAAGKLPAPDDDSIYMTYFPSGFSINLAGMRSCQRFCAYHGGFKSQGEASIFYGVMPVCGGFACGIGSAFDTLSVISSHEVIEAITDPFPAPGDNPVYPQAWNTKGGAEISDLCVGKKSSVTGHGIKSQVTQNWDNNIRGCAKGPWQQFASADLVEADPGAPGTPLTLNPSWMTPRDW